MVWGEVGHRTPRSRYADALIVRPERPCYWFAESFARARQHERRTADLDFRVGRPNLEFDQLDLNDELLKRLADKTKGKYVTLVGLGNFISRLKSDEQAKSTITSVNVWSDTSLHLFGQDISLYLVVAFTLFSALVTAEWVLRKRKQLI